MTPAAVPGAMFAMLLLHLLDRFFAGRAVHYTPAQMQMLRDTTRSWILWGTETAGDLDTWQETIEYYSDGTPIKVTHSALVRWPFLQLRVPLVRAFRETYHYEADYVEVSWCRLIVRFRGERARYKPGWTYRWVPINATGYTR